MFCAVSSDPARLEKPKLIFFQWKKMGNGKRNPGRMNWLEGVNGKSKVNKITSFTENYLHQESLSNPIWGCLTKI